MCSTITGLEEANKTKLFFTKKGDIQKFMLDQMIVENHLIAEKSLAFFGNSTFINPSEMGFDISEKLVDYGILEALEFQFT
jgi:hypothetical protein